MGFGYSFSKSAKDMDDNDRPDFTVGAVSSDDASAALFVASRQTVAITSNIKAMIAPGQKLIHLNHTGPNKYHLVSGTILRCKYV